MIELKPCPFCGGEAKYWPYEDRVSCTKFHDNPWHNCRTAMHGFNGESAVTVWNRRYEIASATPTSNPALRNLPATLIAEHGGGLVSIWRADRQEGESSARKCTVGEWLSQPENQSGAWLIDGGWGGPPGPVKVVWDADSGAWRNMGFPPW